MNALFRSGWWVVAAAAAILLGTLAWLVRPGPSPLQGDGVDPTTYGFDLSCQLTPAGSIIGGGMARDGLHALEDPPTIQGADVAAFNEAERGKLLVSDDRVIGVHLNDEARAYPLRLMRWHEVVNDTVGGEPIAVSYSGLCDASAVWRRDVGGAAAVFAVSGLVHDSNTILYDRSTTQPSLWSQLTGKALAGPAACDRMALEGVPAEVVRWADWFTRHPDTLVMAPLPELKRLYKRDPYHSYFGSQLLHFPVDPQPAPGPPAAKDRVAVIQHRGEHLVVPLTTEDAAAHLEMAGDPLTLHISRNGTAARVESVSSHGDRPVLRLAFWFAWYAQNPEDRPWRPAS